MKVGYVFATSNAATFKLAGMILPQLEAGDHGADVVGMMFFDDNVFALRDGDPIGERLSKVALERGIVLMVCDQCARSDAIWPKALLRAAGQVRLPPRDS